MTAVPTPSQLADLDDQNLDALAGEWRRRAGHGERHAFGVAHALEVERRRRVRATLRHELPQQQPLQQPWWKFWQSEPDGDGPLRRT